MKNTFSIQPAGLYNWTLKVRTYGLPNASEISYFVGQVEGNLTANRLEILGESELESSPQGIYLVTYIKATDTELTTATIQKLGYKISQK